MSFSVGMSSCTSGINGVSNSTGSADSNAEQLVTKSMAETPNANML